MSSAVEGQCDGTDNEGSDEEGEACGTQTQRVRCGEHIFTGGKFEARQGLPPITTGLLSFSSSLMSSMLVEKNSSGSLSRVRPSRSGFPPNCMVARSARAAAGVDTAKRGCTRSDEALETKRATRKQKRPRCIDKSFCSCGLGTQERSEGRMVRKSTHKRAGEPEVRRLLVDGRRHWRGGGGTGRLFVTSGSGVCCLPRGFSLTHQAERGYKSFSGPRPV